MCGNWVTRLSPWAVADASRVQEMIGFGLPDATDDTVAFVGYATTGMAPASADFCGVMGDDTVVYFAGIDGARFKRPVVPGDQLTMRADLEWQRRGIWRFRTTASVGEQLAVEASLMCTMRPA